ARPAGAYWRTRAHDHWHSTSPRFERDQRERLEQARHHERRASGERVPLVLFAQAPEMPDARILRHPHLGVSDEHERRVVRGIAPPQQRGAREELDGVLALDDSADVEQVRAVDSVLLTEALGVAIRG